MKSRIWTIDKSKLQDLFDRSSSYTEVLKRMGYNGGGDSFKNLKKKTDLEKTDLSKMKINAKKNLSRVGAENKDIFVEDSTFSRKVARDRILKNKLINYKCSECNLSDKWNGKDITMVLDHVNGVNNDHRLVNLRFLCPNCNSQTSTFSGRNSKGRSLKIQKECPICENIFMAYDKEDSKKYCSKACFDKVPKKRKIKNRPSKEELEKMLGTMSWCAIGRHYVVSDNTIRNWARGYGIVK